MATQASPAGCAFCDIVAGRSPASVVHSDETVIAFLDIRPLTTGHLLVIPGRTRLTWPTWPRIWAGTCLAWPSGWQRPCAAPASRATA